MYEENIRRMSRFKNVCEKKGFRAGFNGNAGLNKKIELRWLVGSGKAVRFLYVMC